MRRRSSAGLRPGALLWALLGMGCAPDPGPALAAAARGEPEGLRALAALPPEVLPAPVAARAAQWAEAETQRAALLRDEPARLAEEAAAAQARGAVAEAALAVALGLRAYGPAPALISARDAILAAPLGVEQRAAVHGLFAEATPEDPAAVAQHAAEARRAALAAALGPEALAGRRAAVEGLRLEVAEAVLLRLAEDAWAPPDWARFSAGAEDEVAALFAAVGAPPPSAAGPAAGPAALAARVAELTRAGAPVGISGALITATFIEGGLWAVDPYAQLVGPAAISGWAEGHAGSFVGAGVRLRAVEAEVWLSPLPDGPAWAAGLHQDDVLVAMSDPTGRLVLAEAPAERRLALAEAGMRGPADSPLSLELRRAGAPLTLRFPRGEVVLPTVSGAARGPAGPSLWLSAEDGLGYVKISAFKPTSLAAFDALVLPAAPELRGLVLDLRGNGGGDVNAAVQIADRFIAEGALVQAVGQRPPPAGPLTDPVSGAPLTPWDQAVPGDALEGLPLVVLVDADSASAAEVLAGALQQRAGALVVGGPTFGKGAAQRLYTDPEGRFALQYTNLLWALPDGRRLHRAGAGGGLVPDLRLTQGPAAQGCADAAARRRAEPAAHPDGAPFRTEVQPCADPSLLDAPLLAAELILLAQRARQAAPR
ncbi:MAG: hypothetical protein JNM72_07765 [Deltaproteobacteria bacterium]|nr:hypothetical protein [Deltaproteobacteria bacterium]